MKGEVKEAEEAMCNSKDEGRPFDSGSPATSVRREHSFQRKLAVCETYLIISGPVIMGLFLELVGPTLPDLMHRVNCHYEAIARALAARGAGHMLTSILGGIMASKLKGGTGAFLSIAFLLGAIGTVAAPWCSTLILLTAALLLQGFANGWIDTLSTVACSRLWQEKSALPLHALHFGYGVGALIAPQLALPFIMRHVPVDSNETSTDPNVTLTGRTGPDPGYSLISDEVTATNVSDGGLVHEWQSSRIEIPYTVSGLLSVALSLSLASFYFCRRGLACPRPASGADGAGRVADRQRACRAGRVTCSDKLILWTRRFGACLFTICFLLFNFNGGLHAYTKFLYSFATEGALLMSDTSAAALNTAFWLSFTGGRAVCLLVSKWTSPLAMLSVEALVNVASGTALFAWGVRRPLLLWVGSILFGFSMGPLIPTMISCANLYLPLEGASVSLMFFNLALGAMCYQYFAGYLYDTYGPTVHMAIVFGYCVTTTCAMVVMCILLRNRNNRFQNRSASDVIEQDVAADGILMDADKPKDNDPSNSA